MALDSTIPKIWSARFLANLDKALVYGNAVNRDYQSDASVGSSIEINSFGDVTIGDYVKNTDMSAAEDMTTTAQTLLIDQQKSFNLQIDNIDTAQTANQGQLMNRSMQRAGYAMADVVDTYVAGLAEAGFTGAIGTDTVPVTPDAATIYGYLTEAAQILDEANIPTYERYCIMSPSGIKLLKDSGVYLSDTGPGDTVRYMGQFNASGNLPEGYKGEAAGFTLYMSNNTVATGSATSVWSFGHRMGIAFVDSLNTMNRYVPELRFAEAVKGLYIYGARVTQPTAGVSMYTTL